jgi:nitroimidazol reductase NimA-like FMN-containing flavoprotein (pyridoxamine 5'-phosphate oxidase superfamily)
MEEHKSQEVRRKDRETSVDAARELLGNGQYGVLSTVGPSGEPYGVPLSYVYRDGHIYFHSAPEGRKLDNLVPNARASFCVVGATEVLPAQFSTRYQSAIASGEVRELEGEEKIQALVWLVEKYAPEFLQQGKEYIASAQQKTRVFALHVRHLTGKQRR